MCIKLFIYPITLFIFFLSCAQVTKRNKDVSTDTLKQVETKEKDTIPTIEVDAKNSNRVLYDSVYSHVYHLNIKDFTVKTSIVFKEHKIVIESEYLNDSVSVEESNMFNPIPLKQEMFFYTKGQLNARVIYPARMITQKTESGEPVKMLDNVIVGAGIIKGRKGNLLVVGGYGGCNDCSEFEGYYTLEGKSIGINYRTKSEVFISTADIDKIISTYQLDEKELHQKKYSWVRIYQ